MSKESVTRAGPPAPADGKKWYRAPSLFEWGSIEELTRGAAAGADDFPFVGGSSPI